jgi:hypothetical protein
VLELVLAAPAEQAVLVGLAVPQGLAVLVDQAAQAASVMVVTVVMVALEVQVDPAAPADLMVLPEVPVVQHISITISVIHIIIQAIIHMLMLI